MQILQPILVYSKYCKHSLQLINYLENVPEIGNALLPLCIDPQVNEEGSYVSSKDFMALQTFLNDNGYPKISKVPTVVIGNGDQILLLSGSDAFNWLQQFENTQNMEQMQNQPLPQQQQQQQQQQQEPVLEGVNPNEMMSFSDSYSMLNSDNVSSQSYQFIDRQFQTIPTHEEQAIGNKEKFCQQKYEELLKEREYV